MENESCHSAQYEGFVNSGMQVYPPEEFFGGIKMTTPPLTTLHFQTHVSDSGVITLPPMPEYRDRHVEVVLRTLDDDCPAPTDEQLEKMYTMCRGCLEGMTQDEFDQLREDRIMGVK